MFSKLEIKLTYLCVKICVQFVKSSMALSIQLVSILAHNDANKSYKKFVKHKYIEVRISKSSFSYPCHLKKNKQNIDV